MTVEIEGSSEREVATKARGTDVMMSDIFIGCRLNPVLARDIRCG
jgi:hypothetical protein